MATGLQDESKVSMRLLSIACLFLSLAALSLGVLAPMTAQAGDAPEIRLYRYIDNRGVTVLDRQGVPPEYAGKGYEVLNAAGRVVQVVPPPPTAAELRQAEVDKVQADADAKLLHMYNSVEDLDRARARKLAELDTLVGAARGNLQGLTTQQSNLQSQAADMERAGRPVPQALIDQLNELRDQQKNLQADILRYQQARQQADAGFALDRARIEKLLR